MTYFCVQSVAGRSAWAETQAHIEASDIGKNYRRLIHPQGMSLQQFFVEVLQDMYDSGEEIAVRFEDDLAGVNSFIKHNIESWPALKEPHFGCGWLMAPGGVSDTWRKGQLHCSLGVVLERRIIPHIIERVLGSPLPQDLALTQAVADMGLSVAIHQPSLVAHNILAESVVGNQHSVHDTDRGTFSQTFRRAL